KGYDGPDSLIIDRAADEFDPSTGHLPQVPPEGIKRLRAAGLDDEPHRLERPTPLQEPQEGGERLERPPVRAQDLLLFLRLEQTARQRLRFRLDRREPIAQGRGGLVRVRGGVAGGGLD